MNMHGILNDLISSVFHWKPVHCDNRIFCPEDHWFFAIDIWILTINRFKIQTRPNVIVEKLHCFTWWRWSVIPFSQFFDCFRRKTATTVWILTLVRKIPWKWIFVAECIIEPCNRTTIWIYMIVILTVVISILVWNYCEKLLNVY